MNLYLLRHAIAVEHGTPEYDDDDRPLTPDGKAKFRDSIKGIRSLELSFDLILSSPLPRATQTADIFVEVLKLRNNVKLDDNLAPDGDARKLIKYLNALQPATESIVLVGHEPCLSGLVSLLTCGDESLAMNFKKGALCKLTVGSLKHGRCATLEWILTPRQMSLMK